MSPVPPPASPYRGSQKHKNRPTEERKGTLCPEWTHVTQAAGYGHDPFAHDWIDTAAHQLFQGATPSEDGRRRFATANGVAFEAKPTGDGTWHGYPVPWEAVPARIMQMWVDAGLATKRQMRNYWRVEPNDLRWAIEAGTP